MSVGVRASALCLLLGVLMSCGTVAPEVSTDLPSTGEPSETVTATIAERQIDAGSDSAASDSGSEQVMFDDSASFTEASAAKVAVARVSQTQHMLYGDDVKLAELTTEATTPAGRRALRALVDAELAPVRNALATAPPATTWFVVRPLTVKVPVLEPDVGRARTTVWTVELFSRVGVVDPEMLFFETDVVLLWDGVDWLVDDYVVRPGPVARLGVEQYPVTAGDLELRLGEHRLIDPITLEGWGI